MAGFIAVPHDLIEALPPGDLGAFLDIVRMAAYSDHRFKGLDLERGEVVLSTRELAERWKDRSHMAASRLIKRLMDKGLLRYSERYRGRNSGGTVYVVVSYDTYKGAAKGAVTPTVTPAVTQKDQGKKDTRKKEVQPSRFAEIRAVYPKRRGGQGWPSAEKAYCKLVANGHTHEELLAKTEEYASYVRSDGKEGSDYVLMASSFFGPKRQGYEDEWTTTATQRRGGMNTGRLRPTQR